MSQGWLVVVFSIFEPFCNFSFICPFMIKVATIFATSTQFLVWFNYNYFKIGTSILYIKLTCDVTHQIKMNLKSKFFTWYHFFKKRKFGGALKL
jgi:hypothetical protein